MRAADINGVLRFIRRAVQLIGRVAHVVDQASPVLGAAVGGVDVKELLQAMRELAEEASGWSARMAELEADEAADDARVAELQARVEKLERALARIPIAMIDKMAGEWERSTGDARGLLDGAP